MRKRRLNLDIRDAVDILEMKPVRKKIPNDGNCFFHCLSNYLSLSHVEIRLKCIEYLRKNKKFCSKWGITDHEIEEVSKSGVWKHNVMDIMPLIACNTFNITLRIDNVNTKMIYLIEPDKKMKRKYVIDLVLENEHYEPLSI